MEKRIITNEEAVEKMLAFVNRNLVLDGTEIKKSKSRTIITGTGIEGEKSVLEIITPSGSGRPITAKYLEGVTEKDKRQVHGKRSYRAFILPRSILYWNAPAVFDGTYLRPAGGITKLQDMLPQFREYFQHFDYTSSIGLSRAEQFLADIHSGDRAMMLNYYNPLKDSIQQVSFRRYPADEPIPSNLLWIKHMAYRLFPTHPTASKEADEKFKELQDGLHEKVRIMIVRNEIASNQKFTLTPRGKGAGIIAYNPAQYEERRQLELLPR